MKKPRHTIDAKVLALSALLLLPACSPRKAIPSDPPDVRTEAQVRGTQRVALQEAPAPAAQPVAQAAAQPVVQQAAKSAPQAVQAEMAQPAVVEGKEAAKQTVQGAQAKVAEVKAEVKAGDAKVAEAKPAAAKTVDAKVVETKAAELKAEAKTEAKTEAKAEAKALQAKADAKTAEAKELVAKAEPAAPAADQQNATQQQAAPAPRVPLVQIASFNTEKNAQGALSWLKGKGYSEARVVQVEQGQTVYHRVQAGPFQDLAAARKALEELKTDWPQAFIPAD